YSSPLGRCLETAQAITDSMGRKPTIAEDIRECSFGEWENLKLADVLQNWPDGMRSWLADESVRPPGGESWQELGERVERWVGEGGRLGRLRQGVPMVLARRWMWWVIKSSRSRTAVTGSFSSSEAANTASREISPSAA